MSDDAPLTLDEIKVKLAEMSARYGPQAGADGPPRMVRELLGVEPDEWQEKELLRPFGAGERRITVQACHNPGKTAGLTWCALNQLLFRIPQKTAVTSPTNSQMFDVFLAEFKKWAGKLPAWLQSLIDIKSDHIELIPSRHDSYITLKTAKADQPEALSGVHREDGYVLLIVDEGSGVPGVVFENAGGSMAGPRVTTLMASNPVKTSGFFYNAMTATDSTWRRVRITGDPEDELGPGVYYTPRLGAEYIKDIIGDYGRDSNQYRVRVQGLFPRSTADTIIPFEMLQAAYERDIKDNPYNPMVWGLDCGLADLSTLCKRRTNVVPEPIKAWSGLNEEMLIVGHVMAEWNMTEEHERPVEILVDSIGMGAGVASRLRELKLPARSINVSESPAMADQYRNLRTELWFLARQWFSRRECKLPKDVKLEVELLAQKYKPLDSSGKVYAIPKREMIKHIHPQRSPDRAEAFILTFASNAVTASGARSADWSKPLKRNLKEIV